MSTRRLIGNSASGVLLYGINLVTVFVLSPLLAARLGAGGLGIWELLMGIMGYMGVLELGLGPAVVQHVAYSVGLGDVDGQRRALSTALALLLGLGCAAATVLVASAPAGYVLLGLPASDAPLLRLLFQLVAPVALLSFCVTGLIGALYGMQRHGVVNLMRSGMSLLRSGVLYWLLHTDVQELLPLLMGAVMLPEIALECLLLLILLRRAAPHLSIRPRLVSRASAGSLIRFGLKSTVMSASKGLMWQGLPFLVAHTMAVSYVPYYVFPARLVDYALTLLMVLGVPLSAYFSTLAGGSTRDEQRARWQMVTRVEQALIFAMAGGLATLGSPFLARWMGPLFGERGQGPVLCFAGLLVAQGIASNAARILQSQAAHGRAAVASLCLAVVCLAAGYPLLLAFGLTGAALAALAWGAVRCGIEVTMACTLLGVSVGRHVRLSLARVAPAVAAQALTIYSLMRVLPPTGYAELAVHALLGCLSYAIVYVTVGLSASERRALVNWARYTWRTRS